MNLFIQLFIFKDSYLLTSFQQSVVSFTLYGLVQTPIFLSSTFIKYVDIGRITIVISPRVPVFPLLKKNVSK